LKQAVDAFDFIGTQLAECDTEIEQQLQALKVHDGEPAKGKKRGRARNAPKFDLRTQLFKMCGVDLTRIDGVDVTTALAVISETGVDMSRFRTVGHLTSWLDLCPVTKITGGKVMSGKTKRVAKRSAQGLRLAAAALQISQSALGGVLQAHVLADGHTQGRHRRSPQARVTDLHDADEGQGIHRSRTDLLRGARPPTYIKPGIAARQQARHETRR
jgi:transposase